MQPARNRSGFAEFVRVARDSESGAAALEFALLLPIFVLLIFGCFEVGRAILVRQAMEGAVRAGARFLARVPDPTCRPACAAGAVQAVRLTADQIRANTGLPSEAIQVAPQRDPPSGTVAMQATVVFDALFLDPATFHKRWVLNVSHQERSVGE